jgi:transcription antitermination factor NusG
MGITEYLPIAKKARQRAAGRERSRPLFPGYLFCHIDLKNSPKLYQIPGFTRILGTGSRPIEICENEIQVIRSLIEASVSVDSSSPLVAGDHISVTAGPFVGFSGVVVQTATLKKIVVSLPLLKRRIAVTVPIDWIIPCKDHANLNGALN